MKVNIQNLKKKLQQSYRLQFFILTVLAFLGFYKIFSFTFHQNKEIVSILPVLSNPTFFALMKNHVFIQMFNYYLFGSHVWGWYLTALILHLLATFMVVLFVSKITGNRLLGFFTGAWFVVSTAWHDAVTFGTQESLVAAQLFLALIGMYFFTIFRQRQKTIFLGLALLFFLIFTPLRESGLLFYLILFVYDVIYFFPWKIMRGKNGIMQIKNLIIVLKFFMPYIIFGLMALIYILIRSAYGGSPNDASDSRIRLKNALLSEKRYIDYLWYGILGFGFYLPPHILPYVFANKMRNIFVDHIHILWLKLYFFTITGYLYFLTLIILTFIARKRKILKHLLFAIGIIVIPTIFYSYAFTPYEPFFIRDYGYDENRWRYVAFFGTSLFLVVYFADLFKGFFHNKIIEKIVIIIFVFNALLNIFLLWKIEDEMYNDSFKPQKLFYSTFLKTFPKYEDNYILYTYPKSDSFGDYMWEWFGLKNFYYPNLKQLRRDWVYGEMGFVLNLLQREKSVFNNLFFIDFQPDKGVISRTKDARENILHQKTVAIPLDMVIKNNLLSLPIKNISPIEFPYELRIIMKAQLIPVKMQDKAIIPQVKLNALIHYSQSHMDFLKNTKIFDVCGGAQLSPPSDAFNANHLIDGNLGVRSMTFADCVNDRITFDLESEKMIGGVIMGGMPDDPHLPRHYSYEVSLDGKNWTKTMEVERNTRSEIFDKWPNVYRSRYLRINTITTQTGIWTQMDEIEPIQSDALDIFSYWNNRNKLLQDLYSLFSTASLSEIQSQENFPVNNTYASFTWTTNISSPINGEGKYYFPFLIDGNYHTYILPIYDSEFYSAKAEFLKRHINNIRFDFNQFPGEIIVQSVTLLPKTPIIINK